MTSNKFIKISCRKCHGNIEVDQDYYGESITINKVNNLTTSQFDEEEYMTIGSHKDDEFNYGIHTINVVDDIIIVDGQKGYFEPVQQLSRKLKNIFN